MSIMRLNNYFCDLAYGRPMIDDKEYSNMEELKVDYVQAIEDFRTYNLTTFPTVTLGTKEYYAFTIFCDTNDEVNKIIAELGTELLCINNLDIHILVSTDEEEDEMSMRVLDILELDITQ